MSHVNVVNYTFRYTFCDFGVWLPFLYLAENIECLWGGEHTHNRVYLAADVSGTKLKCRLASCSRLKSHELDQLKMGKDHLPQHQQLRRSARGTRTKTSHLAHSSRMSSVSGWLLVVVYPVNPLDFWLTGEQIRWTREFVRFESDSPFVIVLWPCVCCAGRAQRHCRPRPACRLGPRAPVLAPVARSEPSAPAHDVCEKQHSVCECVCVRARCACEAASLNSEGAFQAREQKKHFCPV